MGLCKLRFLLKQITYQKSFLGARLVAWIVDCKLSDAQTLITFFPRDKL